MSNQFERRSWNNEVLRVTRGTVLLAGMIAIGGIALAQNTMPDAQVEANVLKALAGAPELASESITTHTVYGVVTLSGSVRDEKARTKAENLAANANGVTKVVDELRIGGSAAPAPYQSAPAQSSPAQDGGQNAQPLVLQSDGTYAPATATDQSNKPAPGTAPATVAQRNNPETDQQLDLQTEQQQAQAAPNGQAAPNAQPQPQYPQQPGYPNQPQYPQYPQGQAANVPPPNYPQYPQYPQQQPYGRQPLPQYPQYGYPPQQGYPQQGYPQQSYPQQGYPQQNGYAPVPGGQVGGVNVVVPSGSLLRVRINRFLASDRTPVGTTFDGVVSNDVVAGGEVAIPRGATVHGTVIAAEKSGALKGRGELSLQLNSLTLGGKTYPLVSDVWAHNGADKTIQTINSTAGLGAVGAIFGAIAGGGAGAAIGGGIGAAAGLGSSAASHDGQVVIPAEAMLTFHTAQDTPVVTLSEAEMQRLAYGVPAGADQRAVRRPYAYPPGYYPYGPYGYRYP